MSCLLDVESIEAFDDAEFVERVDHVVLDLLFDLEAELHRFSVNDEVVHLW